MYIFFIKKYFQNSIAVHLNNLQQMCERLIPVKLLSSYFPITFKSQLAPSNAQQNLTMCISRLTNGLYNTYYDKGLGTWNVSKTTIDRSESYYTFFNKIYRCILLKCIHINHS